jgi:hypothetical protein
VERHGWEESTRVDDLSAAKEPVLVLDAHAPIDYR